MKTYLSLFLVLLIIGCSSKSSVTRVGKATEESNNSFYYALPKSNLVVTFDVEKKK